MSTHADTQQVAHTDEPSATLLRAWKYLHSANHFITPEKIAAAAQIGHDIAEAYLQDWLRQGVVERAPRYPRYVYIRSRNWHKRLIAQRLNQWIA